MSTSTGHSALTDIRAVCEILFEQGQLVELRTFREGTTYGDFYDDLDALARDAKRADEGSVDAVYITLNPIRRDAIQEPRRITNAIAKHTAKGMGASDADIARRRWLLFDCDPERPTKVSATDEEKALAFRLTDEIAAFLRLRHWPDPLLMDSGNGAHLLYRIDLPAEDDRLIRRVLHALARRFSTEEVKVDKAVHNPARICKLYGTVARKGDNTNERPHRRSAIVHVPETISIVGGEQLEALVEELDPPRTKLSRTKPSRLASTTNTASDGVPTLAEVEEALSFIPARPDYDDWLSLIMAVYHSLGDDAASAVRLLAAWSPEEEDGEYEKKIESLDAGGSADPATFGTLVHLAKPYGYMPRTSLGLGQAPGGDELPTIIVNDRQSRLIVDDALSALIAKNDPAILFRRGSNLACITSEFVGGDERPVIAVATERVIDKMLSRAANFVQKRTSKKGDVFYVPAVISQRLLRQVMIVDEACALPPLDVIVQVPVLRPDGSIVDRPGYDAATRLYYWPPPGLDILPVPARPSRAEVNEAKEILLHPIAEFPFASDADRANMMALMLTPSIRPLLKDNTAPLAGIDSPARGTGKTLLADVVAIIATGRPAATMSALDKDEEWRKQITAILLKGDTFIAIDNVKGMLSSSALEECLTASIWRDRILGKSESVDLPQRATWIASGNNLCLGGDLARRAYMIRLDAKVERPWLGREFEIEDLRAYVRRQRGPLIWAVLTLVRAWIACGQPTPDVKPIGSFEAWTRTVGGILQHAGIEGFLGNLEAMYDTSDDETADWAELLEAMYDHLGAKPFLTKDLARAIENDHAEANAWRGAGLIDPKMARIRSALPNYAADALRKGRSLSRTLGKMFSNRKDRRFDGWYVTVTGERSRAALWCVCYNEGDRESRDGTKGESGVSLNSHTATNGKQRKSNENAASTGKTPSKGEFSEFSTQPSYYADTGEKGDVIQYKNGPKPNSLNSPVPPSMRYPAGLYVRLKDGTEGKVWQHLGDIVRVQVGDTIVEAHPSDVQPVEDAPF